jgi:hypothetical protein
MSLFKIKKRLPRLLIRKKPRIESNKIKYNRQKDKKLKELNNGNNIENI